MMVLQIDQIEKSFDGLPPVLNGVSFHLAAGERVGLVGPNGCGKSTLVKILAQLLPQDSGSVTWGAGLTWAHLSQEGHWQAETPLGDQIGAVPADLLGRCGVTPAMLARPAGQLSGGQRVRAALARVLAGRPAVLLLDEPTNHLDAQGLAWLESLLVDYPGTVLAVSHDRYFLDRVVTRILELEDGKVHSYAGSYADYAGQKQAEQERAEAEYANFRREKKRLEEAIRRQREWAMAAHRKKLPPELKGAKAFYKGKAKAGMKRAKAMEKRLARVWTDKPFEAASVSLVLESGRTGRDVVLARDLGFSYDGQTWVLKGADFFVQRGDRVAIIGPNGSGKSTLLKLILGQLTPIAGSLYVAPRRLAYLAQELESLHPENTVLQEATGNSAADQAAARSLLGCLLFYRDDVYKRVGGLSRGERIRLALAKTLLAAPDLLVLDEPTDGLDLLARERIDEALADYDGTMLLVSHDRYLLRRVATRVLTLEGGHLTAFPGGYEEFMAWQTSGGRPQDEDEADGQVLGAGENTRRLVLEMRLAQLSVALAEPKATDSGRLEAEFLAVSDELRGLREPRRAPPKGKGAAPSAPSA
ncbi:MAG: ribosomal protection-like ABC-F family protein [Symbiobacteriia bacterium]